MENKLNIIIVEDQPICRLGIKMTLGNSGISHQILEEFGTVSQSLEYLEKNGYKVDLILLDYVLAYTVMGLADLFAKPFGKRKLVGYGVGAVCVNLLRFLCSFLSGWIVWGVYAPEGQPAWLYSLLYNGGYMLPNAVLCAIVIVLLCAFVNPKTLKPTK